MLQVGDVVKDFTLNDKNEQPVSLSDFNGKLKVVYFYPKDNTPGCTKQACAFANAYDQFEKLGVPVIGISKDSAKSHTNFANKHELPFILLSDPEIEVIQSFGVWKEKKLYGKSFLGIIRATFVLDGDNKVLKVFEKAKPDTNAQEILDFINSL